MHARLNTWRRAAHQVRIGVADQKGDLKEKEAGDPRRRHAAEPRQQEFADDQFHREEQKRAQQNGCIAEHIEGAGSDGLGLSGYGYRFSRHRSDAGYCRTLLGVDENSPAV